MILGNILFASLLKQGYKKKKPFVISIERMKGLPRWLCGKKKEKKFPMQEMEETRV